MEIFLTAFNRSFPFDAAEPGFDVPCLPGMALREIQTPALLIDLDALDRNLDRMRQFARAHGVRLRAHAKTHKSADIARLQIERGGACGICCQKVSEAEAMVRAGIKDILLSNEVRDPAKLERLARLALHARIILCVDDPEAVPDISAAASKAGTTLEVLVEMTAERAAAALLQVNPPAISRWRSPRRPACASPASKHITAGPSISQPKLNDAWPSQVPRCPRAGRSTSFLRKA
jgi:D-serine deaminase-like pyridoxal phosphate-dependent protein